MSYFNELTEVLGIQNRLMNMPESMSGGQQQRVAIARAMINKPRILFADEPTGNLDRQTGSIVINLLIDNSRKYHYTLVITSHDPEITEMARRIITIEDGIIKNDVKNI